MLVSTCMKCPCTLLPVSKKSSSDHRVQQFFDSLCLHEACSMKLNMQLSFDARSHRTSTPNKLPENTSQRKHRVRGSFHQSIFHSSQTNNRQDNSKDYSYSEH